MALHVATQAYGLRTATAVTPALEVVGEFNLPPDHVDQRDFQALHHDFGVPRLGADPVSVALYTALYLDPERTSSEAATRIVPLRQLLQQREWPPKAVITDRLRSSTRDDSPVEGILARIVESVDLATDLPPKDDDGFLCGMEFASIDEERRYFARHGMSIEAVERGSLSAAVISSSSTISRSLTADSAGGERRSCISSA